MNFFHNRIVNPVNGGPTFQEWVAKLAAQAVDKKASEAKPECDDDPRGQCRGQVINNDNEDGAGYQKGESVDGKKEQGGNARKDVGGKTDQKDNKQTDKEAACGKEMGKCDNAGKVTEKHTPASSTEMGSEKSKGSTVEQNINNDPNYQKGESVTMKKKDKGKKASRLSFQKVASLAQKDKIKLFAHLMSNKNNPIQYVEAMVGIKFANLTPEEKKWLTDFWEIMYPPEYVKEMVKDK